MSDAPRGPRGPATEAIERLAEAIGEQNALARQRIRLARERNAILAGMFNEMQNSQRDRPEKNVSLSSTATRVDSLLVTLYENEK